ncbi:kinetochore protein Spc25 [Scaptodrosophila lebanonensis]|uniref:Kinetochore protein Spc25 n=1 Tax=Drosophila lebanonensis TaxID=7225 RepID=A0A6J2T9S4_DROLE|nr:kinetochore protein Spc25 [Scaptodrosophila lebanonensis]
MNNSYEICARLKRLTNKEHEVKRAEIQLAKKTEQFRSDLTAAKIELRLQQRECDELRSLSTRRNGVLQKEREKLVAVLQRSAEIQAMVTERTTQLVMSERKERNRMHELKEATNIYINHKALPERLQGVIVLPKGSDTSSSCGSIGQWVPFSMDGNSIHGLDALLTQLPIRYRNAEQWQELIDVTNRVAILQKAAPAIDLTSTKSV